MTTTAATAVKPTTSSMKPTTSSVPEWTEAGAVKAATTDDDFRLNIDVAFWRDADGATSQHEGKGERQRGEDC
jgi:hypothetical protein